MTVRIGCDNLHYALLTTDLFGSTVVYETPVRLPHVMGVGVNPNASQDTLFADDGPVETAVNLGKVEVSIQKDELTLEERAVLLGHTMTAGVLLDNATDTPPYLAVGFRSQKANGMYKYVWLLKGKFMEFEINNETRNDTVNFQTDSITGQFVARDTDQLWRATTDQESPTYVEATGTAWFTKVHGEA